MRTVRIASATGGSSEGRASTSGLGTPNQPARFLVFGLSEAAREVLEPFLSRRSITVERPASAAETLELARSRSFDAVVLGHPLPGQDCLELVQSLLEPGSASHDCRVFLMLSRREEAGRLPALEDRVVSLVVPAEDPVQVQRCLSELLGEMHRRWMRVMVRLEVSLGPYARDTLLSRTLNISASGALVKTSRPYPTGKEVSFKLLIPDEPLPIRGQARVVRQTDPEIEGIEGVGLQFVCFEEGDADRLQELLARAAVI